jgi:hypothetical protein
LFLLLQDSDTINIASCAPTASHVQFRFQQEFALFLARFENARAALGGNHYSSLLRLKVLPS